MKSLPKPKREKDSDYLEYIRKQPCLAKSLLVNTCSDSAVDAHHVVNHGKGKVGSKVDDRMTVPLCRFHHEIYHRLGLDEFEARYAVILNYEVVRLNRAYRPPVKKKREKTLPRIRHTAVDCVCGKTHKLTPAKFNDGSFFCPISRMRVNIA